MKMRSADLIRDVQAQTDPIFITQNGEPQAVLQSLEQFKKQRDLLLLLRLIALGEQEVKREDLISQDRLYSRINDILGS